MCTLRSHSSFVVSGGPTALCCTATAQKLHHCIPISATWGSISSPVSVFWFEELLWSSWPHSCWRSKIHIFFTFYIGRDGVGGRCHVEVRDKLMELILSFHPVGPGIEPWLSGWWQAPYLLTHPVESSVFALWPVVLWSFQMFFGHSSIHLKKCLFLNIFFVWLFLYIFWLLASSRKTIYKYIFLPWIHHYTFGCALQDLQVLFDEVG